MPRRATIAFALAVGVLATGTVALNHGSTDHLKLTASNVSPGQPIKAVRIATDDLPKVVAQQTPKRASGFPGLKPIVKKWVLFRRTADASCSVSNEGFLPWDGGYSFDITGYALYHQLPGKPTNQWTEFRYKVEGLTVGARNHNNVNIRLSENGTTRFADKSPDNRRLDTWYSVKPDRPVYTGSDNRVTVDFRAIFDASGQSDPKCTARVTL
jgi:hypothetical protein